MNDAEIQARKAEHSALHRYLVGCLRDQQHRAPTVSEYQDLVSTHDAVCLFMSDSENTDAVIVDEDGSNPEFRENSRRFERAIPPKKETR